MIGARVKLAVAAILFFGWLAWLSYASLAKDRGPIVSHSQAAAATVAVVARVNRDGDPATQATVQETLSASGPTAGTLIDVENLPEAVGWSGPNDYLLLLIPNRVSGSYFVVGQQRSPGYDLAGVGPPRIYPWSNEVRAQMKTLIGAR